MKRIFRSLPAVLIALLLTAGVATAHHSFAMFDKSVEKVVTGSVVRWAFNNPHSWLYVNVKNKDGSETLWGFEASSPTQLLQRGINGYTFEPNSTITVQFCQLKDGRPGGGIPRILARSWLFPRKRRVVRRLRDSRRIDGRLRTEIPASARARDVVRVDVRASGDIR